MDTSPTFQASLIAIGMGLIKIIEKLVEWGSKKIKKANGNGTTVVSLDPETSRMLARVGHIDEIVSVRDNDGRPLVYSPRSMEENMDRVTDILKEVAASQMRVYSRMDENTEKLDEILATLRARK